ncbi:MAG: hypothetical protein IPH45_02685 [Bacteroidales bacterium]|nr:hypothetical protein [Bacteroidales bacterium]
MKQIPALLILVTLIFLQSCKKDEIVESYQRGGNSLVAAPDGNMVIAGFNNSESSGFDAFLTKVNSSGEVIWESSYGDNNSDAYYHVINGVGGGYVASGFQTSTTSNSRTSMLIRKVKEDGSSEWASLFGVGSISQGFSLTSTSDSGYIACGYIMDDFDDDRDIYLAKVNSSGEKVWDKRIGSNTSTSAKYDEAYAIAEDSDGSVFITGSMAGNVSCCGDAFLMKLSSTGDSLWTKTFSEGLGYSLEIASDGTIAIGGMVEANGQDLYLIKATASGEKVWEKTFGGTGFDYGTTLVLADDGGYAITGITAASGSANQNILLNKYDAGGNLSWTKTFGGDDVDQGIGLIQHEDGGFSITGLSNSGGSFIFLNRTSSTGEEIWQKKLN